MTPKATELEKRTPSRVSKGNLVLVASREIPMAITNVKARALRYGLTCRSNPRAIPVRAAWPMASEKNDIFRKTTKTPTMAMSTPRMSPIIRVRWKKGR